MVVLAGDFLTPYWRSSCLNCDKGFLFRTEAAGDSVRAVFFLRLRLKLPSLESLPVLQTVRPSPSPDFRNMTRPPQDAETSPPFQFPAWRRDARRVWDHLEAFGSLGHEHVIRILFSVFFHYWRARPWSRLPTASRNRDPVIVRKGLVLCLLFVIA